MSDLISKAKLFNLLANVWTLEDVYSTIQDMPTEEPEGVIHCKECIYYDAPHVENDGVRYEYTDMPAEAFDELGTGLVTLAYGINVGGRCCRDYNVGYSEDKRVFVPENNYCGRGRKEVKT